MSEIKELIPHRDPFLFVDRLEVVTEDRIVGYRTFKDSEPFFQGHFPEYPVVPGVILVETMAQCGGAGVRQLGSLGEKLFFLATVEKAKFRRQVRPNDEVRLEIENIKVSHRMIKQSGKALVGDDVAAEAEWMCLVGDARFDFGTTAVIDRSRLQQNLLKLIGKLPPVQVQNRLMACTDRDMALALSGLPETEMESVLHHVSASKALRVREEIRLQESRHVESKYSVAALRAVIQSLESNRLVAGEKSYLRPRRSRPKR